MSCKMRRIQLVCVQLIQRFALLWDALIRIYVPTIMPTLSWPLTSKVARISLLSILCCNVSSYCFWRDMINSQWGGVRWMVLWFNNGWSAWLWLNEIAGLIFRPFNSSLQTTREDHSSTPPLCDFDDNPSVLCTCMCMSPWQTLRLAVSCCFCVQTFWADWEP